LMQPAEQGAGHLGYNRHYYGVKEPGTLVSGPWAA
jgi:hypothetical protein